jgi:hypothetical protein
LENDFSPATGKGDFWRDYMLICHLPFGIVGLRIRGRARMMGAAPRHFHSSILNQRIKDSKIKILRKKILKIQLPIVKEKNKAHVTLILYMETHGKLGVFLSARRLQTVIPR